MKATIIYRCPNTGRHVEASIEAVVDDMRWHEPHFCPACWKIHLINRATGKLLLERQAAPSVPAH